MKTGARVKAAAVPGGRVAQEDSDLTRLLSRIDPGDRRRWPDHRIGTTLFACEFISAAESTGQPISESTLALVAGMFDESDHARDTDPAELRDAMAEAMRAAAPGRSASEAGAAFRAALLYRNDAFTTRRHRSSLKANSQKGVQVRRKYTEEDIATWQRLAAGRFAHIPSKLRRAELIARELKLPREAVSTIRRKL